MRNGPEIVSISGPFPILIVRVKQMTIKNPPTNEYYFTLGIKHGQESHGVLGNINESNACIHVVGANHEMARLLVQGMLNGEWAFQYSKSYFEESDILRDYKVIVEINVK